MNNEYIEFVKSRAKGGDAILLSLTPEKCHLLHMAIGISGEAAELLEACKDYLISEDPEKKEKAKKHMREEVGDLLFYITGATFALPSWTEDTWYAALESSDDKYPSMDFAQGTVLAAGDFLDLVKKYTVYNKPFDELTLIESLKQVIIQLTTYYTDDILELCHENMTKLLKRYANGYSDKAAQERADKNPVDGE